MTHYRNIDMRGPDRLRIVWEMLTEDDDSTDAPDERQDGFWPSTDPGAAGYVKPEDFNAQQRIAQERMDGWTRGDWRYVGIKARALIYVPIGGGSYTIHEMESAGLWGIESDSGEYLTEVFNEEKSDLLHQLKTMGQAIAAEDFDQKG